MQALTLIGIIASVLSSLALSIGTGWARSYWESVGLRPGGWSGVVDSGLITALTCVGAVAAFLAAGLLARRPGLKEGLGLAAWLWLLGWQTAAWLGLIWPLCHPQQL